MAGGVRLASGVLRTPAAWCFAAAWGLAAIVLVASGRGGAVLLNLALLAGVLLFGAMTFAITEDEEPASPRVSRVRLALQLAGLVLLILATTFDGLRFHGLLPPSAALPLWTPAMDALGDLGERLLPVVVVGSPANALLNPTRYFLLPLLLLLVLGARLPELGFGRGHRLGRVLLIWCAIPAAFWLLSLLSGALTPLVLGATLLSNALQNGFFEEFLFRGALQTRLAALLGPTWALVLQALLFGAWHLGLGAATMGGDLAAGLAFALLNAGTLGLAFGILLRRTRNLAAPSLFHVTFNSL
jgi:membrane protease YdiL (CAAX protease family)